MRDAATQARPHRPRARAGRCRLTPFTRQRGVNLIAALFVLVVLSALAVFIVTLAGTQHQTSALAAQSARAWYAAQGGLELGAYRAVEENDCQDASETVEDFEVEITCAESQHRERGRDFSLFRITATATGGSTEAGDRVKRQVATSVRRED